MLEIVQFENGRYGLQNTWTGIVVDREFRTIWGARRSLRKRTNKLARAINRVTARG